MKPPVRVRFAPSPTGLLHLGSVRTALFNYLFAKQKDGTFVLRIEDTDPERNFDPGGTLIIQDLAWLGLSYDEGPLKGGPYAPYLQSERTELYQKELDLLIKKNLVYRCFCSEEVLEKKRTRQMALKMPPRYDRSCLELTETVIEEKCANNEPFIWRFKVDTSQTIEVKDLARGSITFNLEHFADFPLTRKNGSFTFLFANAVDDMLMNITYVFRGEDHLSNTPCQALLYRAFDVALPTFWHMPIICNAEGKKLSKRDFGFSLKDLQQAGFLPEAINNYLAIIGTSFKQEIMSLPELVKALDFEHLSTNSSIRYDVEKLRWVNHQWIARYDLEKLIPLVTPYLFEAYSHAKNLDAQTITNLIKAVQPELVTLQDVVPTLAFYFERPTISKKDLLSHVSQATLDATVPILKEHLSRISNPKEYFGAIKRSAQEDNLVMKEFFTIVRLLLTGSTKGLGIKELLTLLGPEESTRRIEAAQ